MRGFTPPTKRQVITRWKQAIRVLKSLTPHEREKHFNMSTWGEKTECGTVACAAGHCGLDPWFRARGFKTVFHHGHEVADEPQRIVKFFGYSGVSEIFWRGHQRSVETVIGEMKDHIKFLEKEFDKDYEFSEVALAND